MTAVDSVTTLELRVIERVLEMSGGYVLDFVDRTFATFFREHGIDIDDRRYLADGTSKAKRLRCFLASTKPPVTGQVLAGLLAHRVACKPDGLDPKDITAFEKIVARLGGSAAEAESDVSIEAALLRRVFQPDVFAKLPVDATTTVMLIGRMEEAHRCIDAKAYLAAIILCGSVLEGMCLGFGCRHPERVNRGFASQYNRSPPQFPDWKLREWIDVLGRLGDLSPNVEKFGQAVRDFRNYVHPAEQLAHRFLPDQHTARIGFQVVVAAAEDLVRAGNKGAP